MPPTTAVLPCSTQVALPISVADDRKSTRLNCSHLRISYAVFCLKNKKALGIYGAIDCRAYVGNFLLAAQAFGLGTMPQAALSHHSGLIRRHFGLGDDFFLMIGSPPGFPLFPHKTICH